MSPRSPSRPPETGRAAQLPQRKACDSCGFAYPALAARHTDRAVTRQRAPYGAWASPITATGIARGSVTLAEPTLAGGRIWWIEGRPREGGRQVIVSAALDGGDRRDEIPAGASARTRVHEYGGGAYAVGADGELWYSNDADDRTVRHADYFAVAGRVVCVRESHESEGEPVNEIVAIAPELETLARGHDFYAAPRLSPDGKQLAYLSWDHPRMPWDGTELWVDRSLVAGGSEESIVQP